MIVKRSLNQFTVFLLLIVSTSCATIVGGSNYHAHIEVPNGEYVKIYHNGRYLGTERAHALIQRRNADKLSFVLKKDNCNDYTKNYTSKKLRGWALFGTIAGWTGVIQGIPVPWGVIVDGATGSWWKPNVYENGIQKIDRKNYRYVIEYKGCETVTDSTTTKEVFSNASSNF